MGQDLPISLLPSLTAATNNSLIPIVASGVTYEMNIQNFLKSQPFGTMYQDWIPDAPSAHTIGSLTYPLKSIFVSTGSVFIGPNNSLAIDDSGVLYSTNVFAAPTFQVGNITTSGSVVTTSGVTFSVINNEMLMVSNSGGTIYNITQQLIPTGGTIGQVLTQTGSTNYDWGWSGLSASQIPTRYYGSFYDTGTQPLISGNTPQAMSANTTTSSNGVIISGGTKFVVQHSGVYNLQFSAQLNKTSSGTDEVAIWFRKNGVDMVESNTEMQVPKQGSTGKLVAAWNIIEQLNANEYIEIVWASADTTYELLHQVAQVSPYAKPSTPSIIVTVTQV